LCVCFVGAQSEVATVFHFTAGVAAVVLSPCESQSQHAVADAGTEEQEPGCVCVCVCVCECVCVCVCERGRSSDQESAGRPGTSAPPEEPPQTNSTRRVCPQTRSCWEPRGSHRI